MIIISQTAQQRGFGSAKYKAVVGLSREEKAIIKARQGMVFFRSRLSGGNHGTTWRVVCAYKDWSGRMRYYPRVPAEAYLEVLRAYPALNVCDALMDEPTAPRPADSTPCPACNGTGYLEPEAGCGYCTSLGWVRP